MLPDDGLGCSEGDFRTVWIYKKHWSTATAAIMVPIRNHVTVANALVVGAMSQHPRQGVGVKKQRPQLEMEAAAPMAWQHVRWLVADL